MYLTMVWQFWDAIFFRILTFSTLDVEVEHLQDRGMPSGIFRPLLKGLYHKTAAVNKLALIFSSLIKNVYLPVVSAATGRNTVFVMMLILLYII